MTVIRSAAAIAVCVPLFGGLAERALAQQVDFQTMAVGGQVTQAINGVREQTLTLNAEFTPGGQSDSIQPTVEDIILRGEVGSGHDPQWIVGIPAGVLMESGKNRWTAVLSDAKAVSASQIKMGIQYVDNPTFIDLLPNTVYFEATLKQKGQSWALEIETKAYFEETVPDWLIVGSTFLTELTIGDDGGIRESGFVGYGSR